MKLENVGLVIKLENIVRIAVITIGIFSGMALATTVLNILHGGN